jgi:hypothetical protein
MKSSTYAGFYPYYSIILLNIYMKRQFLKTLNLLFLFALARAFLQALIFLSYLSKPENNRTIPKKRS